MKTGDHQCIGSSCEVCSHCIPELRSELWPPVPVLLCWPLLSVSLRRPLDSLRSDDWKRNTQQGGRCICTSLYILHIQILQTVYMDVEVVTVSMRVVRTLDETFFLQKINIDHGTTSAKCLGKNADQAVQQLMDRGIKSYFYVSHTCDEFLNINDTPEFSSPDVSLGMNLTIVENHGRESFMCCQQCAMQYYQGRAPDSEQVAGNMHT